MIKMMTLTVSGMAMLAFAGCKKESTETEARVAKAKDLYVWTVTNTSTSTCPYTVCLVLGMRDTGSGTVTGLTPVCQTIASGGSATFSLMVLPAAGYDIVVKSAYVSYAGGTHTGLGTAPGTADIRGGACYGPAGSGWATIWMYTGPRSFSVCQSVATGF